MQYNLLVDAQAIAQWQAITGNQRLMCVLPIHHVNGIVMTLITPLFVGGSTGAEPRLYSQHFWQRIAREGVQIVSVVPTLLQFSLEYAEQQEKAGKSIWGDGVTRHDLRRFRHFVCGAGTLAVSLVKAFEDKFGLPILHGYGLSETTCYSCLLPIDLSRERARAAGCSTTAIPVSAARSSRTRWRSSTRRQRASGCGPGERGEICIRGHNVMNYYFQRPDANAETFKFGWFRSGDEGFYAGGRARAAVLLHHRTPQGTDQPGRRQVQPVRHRRSAAANSRRAKSGWRSPLKTTTTARKSALTSC